MASEPVHETKKSRRKGRLMKVWERMPERHIPLRTNPAIPQEKCTEWYMKYECRTAIDILRCRTTRSWGLPGG